MLIVIQVDATKVDAIVVWIILDRHLQLQLVEPTISHFGICALNLAGSLVQ